MHSPTIVRASDRSVMVRFAEEISLAAQELVWSATRALQNAGYDDLHPGYSSLLVGYDPRVRGYETVHEDVSRAFTGEPPPLLPRTIIIPVCYEGECAPDLDVVARHTGLMREEVIERHLSSDYQVFFLGFSPGFAYLGGLDPALHVPRLATPRVKVPAGSVAIAGKQAAVYPSETPGGWQLIGLTRLSLFEPGRCEALLRIGDSVRFERVTAEEFHRDPG